MQEGEERGCEGARVLGELKPPPTCGEAGPCGVGPISTYLLSPGLLPLAARSCGAQSGAERLAEQCPAVAAASSPLSPTMGLPNRSLSSLLCRLFLLLQVPYCLALVPARTLSGGRAGVRMRRWRLGENGAGALEAHGTLGSLLRKPGMGVLGRARL